MKILHSTKAIHRTARVLVLGALLATLLGSAQPAHAIGTIRFAAPGGMAVGLCNSWVNACHLQYAVTQAVAGDQVWVKQGTHLPIGSRSDSFALKDGVGIYGGFLGTETLLSQRDAEAHVTILSGEIGNPVDASDNSYHVVVSGGTDATAVLDGFTITAGNANYGTSPDDNGGGMYNLNSSPTISNVTLSNNHADYFGGGMYNLNSSPMLTNVTFSGNSAGGGGGMKNDNNYSNLINVTFVGNSALSGGAMYNDASSPTIVYVTFSGNSATVSGAAIFNAGGSAALIYDSIFWNAGSEVEESATSTITDSIVQGGCPAGSFCTNVIDADPLLGPLANNGGSTQTMALGPISPARDAAGANSGCISEDQRGVTRPQGGACDMGAYEYQVTETSVTYKSVGTQDGWILESSETSGAGGTLDAAATQFYLGDDAANKQYRGILSFDTSSLPDAALITSVTLKIKKTGLVGANPFSSLGDIIVDIKNGSFSSNPALQKTDFKALATKNFVAKFTNTPVGSWYSTTLGAGSFGYISRTGTTQFRLRFATDDNNNLLANYLKFASGNATTTSRPQLVITYLH